MGLLTTASGALSGAFSNVKLYVYGAIMLLFALLAFGTYHYHAAYYAEVASYDIVKAQNSDLIVKIQDDATVVDKYKADSDARARIAATALVEAQKKLVYYEKNAQVILLAPPSTNDACTSADAVFNQYIIANKGK